MIQVKKHDGLHIKIISNDRAYIADLKSHFTDFVEGYRFQPRFRQGGWDGKICLVSSGNILPYGLLFDFMSFHKKNYKDIELNIDEDVKDFFTGIDIEPEYDLNIFPRPYQIECIEAALKYKRCILRVSTAGGKSLIISYIIKNLIDTNNIKNAIIIVPTQSLCIQMKNDFESYGLNLPMDVKFNNSKFYKKIKITLSNGTVILKNFEDIIETKRGKIMAKDILETDDIL